MKKIIRLSFFLFLTFISTRALFHRGVPVTHDGNNHLARFANYFLAVKELQLPPRLGPNLLNHYGYPVFNFNYPLANIFSLPFSILGFHYQFTYKIINIAFVFLGIWGAYRWLKEKSFSSTACYFASSLFALTPYLLTTIVYRGNIGEVISWGILPWIFYFLEKINQQKKDSPGRSFFALTLTLIALFLSHNITAFFASALIFFYLLFLFKNNWAKWGQFLLAFVLAFASSLWFWLPALLEKKLTILSEVDLTLNYYKHFPSFKQLLALPIEYGFSYWGRVDSMSFGLGLGQILILFLALIFLVRKFRAKEDQENFVFFILAALLFIFQLPFTKIIYELIPMAEFIQFPWRLALLLSVVLLPITALIFENLKPNWRRFLILLLLLQLVQFSGIKAIDYQDRDEAAYEFFTDTSSVNKENLPKSFIYQDFADWQATAIIIDGQGEVAVEKWRGSSRSYQLNLRTAATIVEPSAYFPGWETKIKAKNADNWQQIDYVDNEIIQGRIAYQLEAGEYLVKSRFTQNTWPRLIGNSVSALSLLVLSYFYLAFLKKERNKQRQ